MLPITITLFPYFGRMHTGKGPMTTPKSQLAQHAFAAMILVLVLGALSMIWPGIIALAFGIFLLLQSCGGEQEIAMLSWAEINSLPIAFTSLRRPGLPAILW